MLDSPAKHPSSQHNPSEARSQKRLHLRIGGLRVNRARPAALSLANFNAYIWWYLRRYYGPLGEDGVITKRGHVMSQFTKFIRPGYVRVGATANPSPGVTVSAYKSEKLVIVAINQGRFPDALQFVQRFAGAVAFIE